MDTLDIVIIVCVVVGTLAFCVVVYILWWAYLYDRRNRQGFLASSNKEDQQLQPNGTDVVVGTGDDVSSYGQSHDNNNDGAKASEKNDTTADNGESLDKSKMPYPVDIEMDEDGAYPESVISEDVNNSVHSKSLGQGYAIPHMNDNGGGNSVASSMDLESYGYSLDANTLATPVINDNMSTGVPVEPTPDRSDIDHLRSSGHTDDLALPK